MANARPTIVGNNKPNPSPVVASVRYQIKTAVAYDTTALQKGIPCDGVMVDTEGCQITGVLGGGQPAIQGCPLSANVLYPISYYTITVISGGNVWMCWFEDPTV